MKMERLQKVLAQSNIASRRKSEEMIQKDLKEILDKLDEKQVIFIYFIHLIIDIL